MLNENIKAIRKYLDKLVQYIIYLWKLIKLF